MKSYFVPELTTASGRCLTSQNLEEVGVDYVAYHLQALLMKPGIDALRTCSSLGHYIRWQKNLVLNVASMPQPNAHGLYIVRSSYDGSQTEYTAEDILELILSLSPQIVILPREFLKLDWQSIAKTIKIFFPFDSSSDDNREYGVIAHLLSTSRGLSARSSDVANAMEPADKPRDVDVGEAFEELQYGVYFDCDKNVPEDAIREALKEHVVYIRGHFNPITIQKCSDLGVTYIESDQPANDAYQGRVYQGSEVVDILSDSHRMQFSVMDSACQCPTCSQMFTYAYLHHLYQHTPLLCQRLLIQHNIYSVIA